MSWTKELPKESGYYWYRWNKGEYSIGPVIADVDAMDQSISLCGNDIPKANWMGPNHQIDGEFWSEKLTEP